MRFFNNILFFLFILIGKAIADNSYCLVGDSGQFLVITSSNGEVKKTIELQGDNYGQGSFVTGFDSYVIVGGQAVSVNNDIYKAFFWLFDLNGDLLKKGFLDPDSSANQTAVNTLYAFENKLYFGGVETDQSDNPHPWFLVTDTSGNVIYQNTVPQFGEINSIIVNNSGIYFAGFLSPDDPNAAYATFAKIGHDYNIRMILTLRTNPSEIVALASDANKLVAYGDTDGQATLWILDYEGNLLQERQFPASDPSNSTSAFSVAILNHRIFLTGCESDLNNNNSNFMLILDDSGNVIRNIAINEDNLVDNNFIPLALMGDKIFVLSTTPVSDDFDNPLLNIYNLQGELENSSILPFNQNVLVKSIYIPSFNFLIKSLKRFAPVKFQRGV